MFFVGVCVKKKTIGGQTAYRTYKTHWGGFLMPYKTHNTCLQNLQNYYALDIRLVLKPAGRWERTLVSLGRQAANGAFMQHLQKY